MTIQSYEGRFPNKDALTSSLRAVIESLKKDDVALVVHRALKDGPHDSWSGDRIASRIQMTRNGYLTEDSWQERGTVVAKADRNDALHKLKNYLKDDGILISVIDNEPGVTKGELSHAGSFDRVMRVFAQLPQQVVETDEWFMHGQPGGVEINESVAGKAVDFIASNRSIHR